MGSPLIKGRVVPRSQPQATTTTATQPPSQRHRNSTVKESPTISLHSTDFAPLLTPAKRGLPADLLDDVYYDISQNEGVTTFEDSAWYKKLMQSASFSDALIPDYQDVNTKDNLPRLSSFTCCICKIANVVVSSSSSPIPKQKHICFGCRSREFDLWQAHERKDAQERMRLKLTGQVAVTHAAIAQEMCKLEEKTEHSELVETKLKVQERQETKDAQFEQFYDQDTRMTKTAYSTERWSTKSAWEDVKEFIEGVTPSYRARKKDVIAGPVLEFQQGVTGKVMRDLWMKKIGDPGVARDWYKETYDKETKQWVCVPWNEYEFTALEKYNNATQQQGATYLDVIYSDLGPVGWHEHGKEQPRRDVLQSKGAEDPDLFDLSPAVNDSNHRNHPLLHHMNNDHHLRSMPRGSPATWSRTPRLARSRESHTPRLERRLADNRGNTDMLTPVSSSSTILTQGSGYGPPLEEEVIVAGLEPIETSVLSNEMMNGDGELGLAGGGEDRGVLGGKTPWMVTQERKKRRARRIRARRMNTIAHQTTSDNATMKIVDGSGDDKLSNLLKRETDEQRKEDEIQQKFQEDQKQQQSDRKKCMQEMEDLAEKEEKKLQEDRIRKEAAVQAAAEEKQNREDQEKKEAADKAAAEKEAAEKEAAEKAAAEKAAADQAAAVNNGISNNIASNDGSASSSPDDTYIKEDGNWGKTLERAEESRKKTEEAADRGWKNVLYSTLSSPQSEKYKILCRIGYKKDQQNYDKGGKKATGSEWKRNNSNLSNLIKRFERQAVDACLTEIRDIRKQINDTFLPEHRADIHAYHTIVTLRVLIYNTIEEEIDLNEFKHHALKYVTSAQVLCEWSVEQKKDLELIILGELLHACPHLKMQKSKRFDEDAELLHKQQIDSTCWDERIDDRTQWLGDSVDYKKLVNKAKSRHDKLLRCTLLYVSMMSTEICSDLLIKHKNKSPGDVKNPFSEHLWRFAASVANAPNSKESEEMLITKLKLKKEDYNEEQKKKLIEFNRKQYTERKAKEDYLKQPWLFLPIAVLMKQASFKLFER